MNSSNNFKKEIKRLNRLLEAKNLEYKKFDKEANHSIEAHLESQSYIEDIDELEHWISHLQTEYLKHECYKRELAMPKTNDETLYYTHDFDNDLGETKILTPEGIELINKKIREDKLFKINEYSFYFTLLSGFIGLVMGLVAFIKNI